MALTATCTGRIRISGNALNGAFYDSSVSGVLSTTLNGAISNSTTTIVVTNNTGWPSSGNYYARIGNVGGETMGGSSEVVQVTGGQGTNTWTVTRGVLGTTGLAFSSGVVVDNELTRCDTAIASGSNGISTASTTFVDATFAAFNSTHVGLGLYLTSGSGTTVAYYIIQSVTNSTTIVLDSNSGTYTAGVWKIGGGAATWINLLERTNATNNRAIPGNTVYIRGSGTDTPSTADYTLSTFSTLVDGTSSDVLLKVISENGRARLDQTGADALVFFTKGNGSNGFNHVEGMYFRGGTSTTHGYIIDAYALSMHNCVIDTNDKAINGIGGFGIGMFITGCTIFGKTASPTSHPGNYGILAKYNSTLLNTIIGNKIYNCGDVGIGDISGTASIYGNEINNNLGHGIYVASSVGLNGAIIKNNTIDSNGGDGIRFATYLDAGGITINNNITNNTGFGVKSGSGTLAQNNAIKRLLDYNDVWNNSTNYSNISAGLHDISVDPQYVGGSPYDYTPTNSALKNIAFPISSPFTSNLNPGAVQESSSGGVVFGPRSLVIQNIGTY